MESVLAAFYEVVSPWSSGVSLSEERFVTLRHGLSSSTVIESTIAEMPLIADLNFWASRVPNPSAIEDTVYLAPESAIPVL